MAGSRRDVAVADAIRPFVSELQTLAVQRARHRGCNPDEIDAASRSEYHRLLNVKVCENPIAPPFLSHFLGLNSIYFVVSSFDARDDFTWHFPS